MSSKDNMFIATGAAKMAYRTEGARIDYGVNAIGRRCGVFGDSGSEFGRESVTAGVGVWGNGAAVGVQGRGSFITRGPDGQPDSAGVRGEGGRFGVAGFCAEGSAIFGSAMSGGRGGEFESNHAQVRLVPSKPEDPNFREIGEMLPANGKTGDLFALQTDKLGATLWFCERGTFEDGGQTVGALWKPVELGQPVTGLRK